jgi:hypothetical protein
MPFYAERGLEMKESVPAIMWGKSYIAECPFCRELVDQYEGGSCPHFKNALPPWRPVFMFEER